MALTMYDESYVTRDRSSEPGLLYILFTDSRNFSGDFRVYDESLNFYPEPIPADIINRLVNIVTNTGAVQVPLQGYGITMSRLCMNPFPSWGEDKDKIESRYDLKNIWNLTNLMAHAI